jgi:hypothetical protein
LAGPQPFGGVGMQSVVSASEVPATVENATMSPAAKTEDVKYREKRIQSS